MDENLARTSAGSTTSPSFALAAIVMNSVIPLVAFGEARHLFHVKKHDFVLWVLTLGHID